jgi:hypothetical protein
LEKTHPLEVIELKTTLFEVLLLRFKHLGKRVLRRIAKVTNEHFGLLWKLATRTTRFFQHPPYPPEKRREEEMKVIELQCEMLSKLQQAEIVKKNKVLARIEKKKSFVRTEGLLHQDSFEFISPICKVSLKEVKISDNPEKIHLGKKSVPIEEKLDDIDEKSDDELPNLGKKRKNSSKMNNSVTSQKKKRKEKPVLTRKVEEAAIKVTKKEKPFVEYSKSKKKDKIIQNEDMDESNTDKAKENIGAKLSSSQMNKSNQRNNARRVIKIIIKKSASHIKR